MRLGAPELRAPGLVSGIMYMDDDMDIGDWRTKIDAIDRKLVELLNERASAVQEIGRIKAQIQAPIYEPDREKTILQNVKHNNKGPLPEKELVHIFERMIDVMRAIQTVAPDVESVAGRVEGKKQ